MVAAIEVMGIARASARVRKGVIVAVGKAGPADTERLTGRRMLKMRLTDQFNGRLDTGSMLIYNKNRDHICSVDSHSYLLLYQ